MKVAFVNHDLGPYGATKSLLDLIDGLNTRGVDCYVILPEKNSSLKEGPLVEELDKRKIPYRALRYRHWVHSLSPNVLSRIKRLVRKFPDNRIYRAFLNVSILPKVIAQLQAWNVDIVYTNTSVVPIGAIAALYLKKPHVWHIREFQRLDHGLSLDWGKQTFRWLGSKSAAIIMVSQAIKHYYATWIDLSKGHVVYNGVASQAEFDYTMKRKAQSGEANKRCYTFCLLGRLSTEKGQPEAIRALGRLLERGTQARLIIAGRGNYHPLEELATNLSIQDNIVFVGHTDDVFSIYLQSDACLVCSSHEAFGRVTIEAMVAALPVIGKKNFYSGTSELIQHSRTGLLYEGGADELATAMECLVKDPAWGEDLGRLGWRYAREHYNREKYVDQIHTILQKIPTK